jgi:hypothetical protein
MIPQAGVIDLWDVASRDYLSESYRITAVIRGPHAEALRAQVRAMINTVTFNPRVEPLVDTGATRAAALRVGVALVRDQADGSSPAANGRPGRVDNPDMSAACFSDVPGKTTEALITGTVFIAHRLTQPLKVRCTSTIEPTEFQLWKITLRYDWDAIGDHPAGTASLVALLAPRGDGFGGDSYGVSNMPYLQPIVTNPPG